MKNLDNWLTSVTIIIWVSCIGASIFLYVKQPKSKDAEPPQINKNLPWKYAYSRDFDVETKNMTDFPIYAYTIASYFESYFNKLGWSLGGIKRNHYSMFNESHIYEKITSYCSKPSKSFTDLCKSLQKNETASIISIMDMIYKEKIYFSDLLELINTSKKVDFEFKSPSYAKSIDEVKTLLFNTASPILVSYANIDTNFFVPTNNKKSIKCPNSYPEKYCTKIVAPTYLENGLFFVPKRPSIPSLSSARSNFILEGYNDQYVHFHGIHQLNTMRNSRGGFIVRGTHAGFTGYPILLFLGQLDQESVSNTCKNEFSPLDWVPANITSQISQYFTTLTCINSSKCDLDHQYTLVQTNTTLFDPPYQEDLYGIVNTTFIDINNGSTIEFSQPYWTLTEYFVPFYPPPEEISCGHYFVPYDYIRLAEELDNQTIEAAYYPVKFPRSTYKDVNAVPVEFMYTR